MTGLPERLAAAISRSGPIPLAQFMAAANAHFHANVYPVATPETGKMFGELVGLWLTDLWLRMKKPKLHFIEISGGHQMLSADVLRAMAMVGLMPDVHFLGISAARSSLGLWHEDLSTLPSDAPLLIIAKDFFCGLPIHQLVKCADGWRQRAIGIVGSVFAPVSGKLVPDHIVPEALRDAAIGSVIETSHAGVTALRLLAEQIVAQGGAAVIVERGYDGPLLGETLTTAGAPMQANPFANPGSQALTAQIDFETLGATGEICGAKVYGPVAQGTWLNSIGLAERTSALAGIKPETAVALEAERAQLVGESKPSQPCRVLAILSPDWPVPDGF